MKQNKRNISTGKFVEQKRRKLTVVAVALVFIMIIAPLYAFAQEPPVGAPALGLSSTPLGASTIYSIYSASDLQLARDLDENGDYSKVVLNIEQDFAIGDVEQWLPLGASEEPFNGEVNGQNFAVSGVGEKSTTTLLGHLKDATIKDLTVYSALPTTDANPYYGLLESAENCTIINCKILPLNPMSEMNLRSLRMGISPDLLWLTDPTAFGGASANPKADTAGKLWAMAEGVATKANTFAGRIVTIDGTIDCQNQPFPGIGNESAPFKGSIKGVNAVIKNLKLSGTNALGTGLIAYADPTDPFDLNARATIEDIRIEGVTGYGNEATGALLGYGKDVAVKNCSVSGSVSGGNEVGTLIGKLVITAPFKFNDGTAAEMATPYVENSYSTADVSGAINVGGLVGNVSIDDVLTTIATARTESDVIIKNCFTTGAINANSQVGGIVGYLDNLFVGSPTDDYAFAVENCGSMSSINASVNVGGIVGKMPYDHTLADGWPSVITSYYSGTINAINYAGGLIGTGGGAKDSYVSGNVVSPVAFGAEAGASVWPVAAGENPVSLSGVYATPDSMYRSGDPLNISAFTTTNWGPYKLLWSAGGDIHEPVYALAPYNFFASGADAPTGFAPSGDLTVNSGSIITGTFPILNGFGTGPAYNAFSTISTNATVARFPSQLYVNASNEATGTPNGVALELPAGIGVTWKINGSTTHEIVDETLEGGKNIVKIENGKLKLTGTVNKTFDVVITGETSNGISLKFPVTFMDEAVRTVKGGLLSAIITEKNPALITSELLLDANMMSITLDEGVLPTNPVFGGIKIELTEYGDKSFGGGTTLHSNGAEIIALNEKVLKVTIDRSLLKSDKSYMVDVASGAVQFEDLAENQFNTKFYFRTVSNSAPVVSFETAFNLYEKNEHGINSTSANKDQQTIGMTENEEAYLDGTGYREGVIIDNPNGQYISVDNLPTSVFTIAANKTMEGSNGYKALNATKSNFYEIPGEYTVTYQVTDVEDPLISSNQATRTYKVFSRAYFTRGTESYSTINALFTSGDMVEVFNIMESQGITVNEAIEKILTKRYLDDPSSPDYLAAYRYSSDGTKETLPVSFDVLGLTDNVFTEGFKSSQIIKAGVSEQVFVLEIQSTSPDFEIEVENSVFVATNSLSRQEARRFFNAKVRQKSTGKIVNYPVIYNFKGVHSNRYNVPQQVEITMIYPNGMSTINGIDMTISRTVSVVLKKENKYQHPEDVEDTVGTFWDKVTSDVKWAKADKVLNYNMTYDEASRTPSDFFIVVKNHEGKPVNMTLPTGIVLSFKQDLINKEYAFDEGISYNLAVEPMYDVLVSRDTRNGSSLQFYTPGGVNLQGELEVTMPLNQGMRTEDLTLYSIDEKTNKYVLVSSIKEEQVSGESITLNLKELSGQYVISDSELEGKIVGRAQ